MSDDIACLAEDVHVALEDLKKATGSVLEVDDLSDKRAAEMAARPFVREARGKVSVLRAKVRRTQDAAMRAQYTQVCEDADEKIRVLDAEMKRQIYPQRLAAAAKSYTDQREEVLMGSGGVDGRGFHDSGQVLSAAIKVQEDMLFSLERAERLQHVTEESGQETLATFQRQTEQMYHIDEELENLNGQLDRAARDLKWFYRQLSGDRCFLSLFGVLILAMIVLVFVTVYKRRHPSW